MTALRLVSRRVHFLAGMVVAPFLIVLSLTGLVYVFSPQIHESLYQSQLFVREPGGRADPVSEQVATALEAHPEATLRSVIPPETPDRTTQVELSVPGLHGTDNSVPSRTVFVDPYTNFINGEMNTIGHRTPANIWLRDLHSNLHLGEAGRWYAELAATWLPLITLGGLVLWLLQPRGRRGVSWSQLLVPSTRNGKGWSALRGLHGPLGLWLSVGLLLIGATGLGMSQFAGGRIDRVADPTHFRDRSLVSTPVELPNGSDAPPGIALPPPRTPPPPPTNSMPGGAEPTGESPIAQEPAPERPDRPTGTRDPEPPEDPPAPPKPPAPSPPPPAPPTTTDPPAPPAPPESPAPPPEETPELTTPPVTTPPPDPTLIPIPLIPSMSATPAAFSTTSAPAPTQPAAADAEPVISIDRALNVARSEGLTGELLVKPPRGAGGVYSVTERSDAYPIQRDSIAVDPYSAKVTERVGWNDFSLLAKASTLGAAFHTGELFGLANQTVLALLAVGLIVLIGLGYRMWWLHNPYRGRWATLPPPVWRQVSRPVLAGLVAGAALLSWVLPVFGPSLVVFVLIDSALTAYLRRRAASGAGAGGARAG